MASVSWRQRPPPVRQPSWLAWPTVRFESRRAASVTDKFVSPFLLPGQVLIGQVAVWTRRPRPLGGATTMIAPGPLPAGRTTTARCVCACVWLGGVVAGM
ncbi:unnamed protein product [Heligmosomoides polygyrus]|uniref:Uncharacterized protein n=1 Tax=Heligmosomoides polygyrus TaxID=6339 RepID=A0A183FY49_HELPZ|nr:unnamed protein product [Heligmosomoides polygyrus]